MPSGFPAATLSIDLSALAVTVSVGTESVTIARYGAALGPRG